MTESELARLTARAKWISKHYKTEWYGADNKGQIYFADERKAGIEHVCHEMAHAALLGIKIGRNLTDRVDITVAQLRHEKGSNAADRNEIDTFAVVMSVFRRLGLSFRQEAMVKEAWSQTRWPRSRIMRRWRDFRRRPEHKQAVRILLGVLQMEAR